MPKDIDADLDPLEVDLKHEAIYDAQIPSWADAWIHKSLRVVLQLVAHVNRLLNCFGIRSAKSSCVFVFS